MKGQDCGKEQHRGKAKLIVQTAQLGANVFSKGEWLDGDGEVQKHVRQPPQLEQVRGRDGNQEQGQGVGQRGAGQAWRPQQGRARAEGSTTTKGKVSSID